MELGKPVMINDEDCDTEYPAPLADEEVDEFATSGNVIAPSLPRSTLLLASTRVTRLYQPLLRIMRSLCVSADTLTEFDKHLLECMQLFPPNWRIGSTDQLDPYELPPIMQFQNTRLILSRHNLSPSCSSERRLQAIEQCAIIACDTAGILARCMDQSSAFSPWRTRMKYAASTFLCTHIWRCMLFTLFCGIFDAFYILLKSSATIGDSRTVNICCGRHILFFMNRLIEKTQQQSIVDLSHDEEMLALVSADLQSSANNSWIWDGAETGTYLAKRQKHGRVKHNNRPSDVQTSPTRQLRAFPLSLSDQEAREWGGWERVEQAARYLQQQWRPNRDGSGPGWPQDQNFDQPLNPVPVLPAPSPSSAATTTPFGPPTPQLSSAARMDMKNFI